MAGTRGREPTMTPEPRPRPTVLTTLPLVLCGTLAPAVVPVAGVALLADVAPAPDVAVLLFLAAAPLVVDPHRL